MYLCDLLIQLWNILFACFGRHDSVIRVVSGEDWGFHAVNLPWGLRQVTSAMPCVAHLSCGCCLFSSAEEDLLFE